MNSCSSRWGLRVEVRQKCAEHVDGGGGGGGGHFAGSLINAAAMASSAGTWWCTTNTSSRLRHSIPSWIGCTAPQQKEACGSNKAAGLGYLRRDFRERVGFPKHTDGERRGPKTSSFQSSGWRSIMPSFDPWAALPVRQSLLTSFERNSRSIRQSRAAQNFQVNKW